MNASLLRLRARTDRPLDRRIDRLGIVLSCLCAVHCVAGIVLVAVLGVGGGLLLNPAIHRIGLMLATLVAALAIGSGALRHRRPVPLMVAMTGLSFMGSALAVEHGPHEMVLTVMGVALVATGHLLNLRHV